MGSIGAGDLSTQSIIGAVFLCPIPTRSPARDDGGGRACGHTCGVRVDGPLARRFLSLTAFQAEGCGSALSGDEYKVGVTGLAFCITWHDKHSVIGSLRSPPPFPATPDFPRKREQNKTPRDNLLINPPLEMTVAASAPIVMLKKGCGWRRSLWPSGYSKKEAPHFEELLFHLRGD